MTIALWVLQGWLAVVFLVAGLTKLAGDRTALARRSGMGYLADLTDARMRLLGLAELAGAVALVLPGLLGRADVLTPLAAACLAVLMAGAVGVHVRRRESALVPAVLLACAVCIVVGHTWGSR